MLSLQSSRWSELQHAYGQAGDMPALLARLAEFPEADGKAEPWFTLWSALAHQGDVYPASFAAVPHVVAAIAVDPLRACEAFFHFSAWVEICRARNGVDIPADLRAPYLDALARLPALVAQAAGGAWSPGLAACALSAVAAAKGQHALSEALLEMSTPAVAEAFMVWVVDQ